MAESFPNPLFELHQQAEAEFVSWGQVQVVQTFGVPQAEYSAIRKGCALFDWPQRGVLELTGKDRLPFLNNLLTNQTWDKNTKTPMADGAGVYAFFLNTKGRIESDMNVLNLPDRTILEMDVRLVEKVRAALDKYLFAEQVKMASRVGEIHEIALHGPDSPELLNAIAGEGEFGEMAPLAVRVVRLMDQEAVIFRDDIAGVPGFGVLLESPAVAAVWGNLVEQYAKTETLGKRTLRPGGWAAFNAARIEACRPIYGIDFDDSILPAETGQMERAVSLTKGCYLGQEIVARMHARGQVARQLVAIRMPDDNLPVAGTQIYDKDQNTIGGVTSSTVSPILSGNAICLGYVKKAFTTEGSVVKIPAEGQMREGVVVKGPFVK